MNPQEAAFIVDIREHPDDDTPRLIFSDWLQENGQEKRARFIKIQCELAGGDYPCPKCNDTGWVEYTTCDCDAKGYMLRVAEREFIIEYGIDELAGFEVPGAMLYAPPLFRRGFVEGLTGSAEGWIEVGDTICAATPLREVQLVTYPSQQESFVRGLTLNELEQQILAIRWPGVKFKLSTSAQATVVDETHGGWSAEQIAQDYADWNARFLSGLPRLFGE